METKNDIDKRIHLNCLTHFAESGQHKAFLLQRSHLEERLDHGTRVSRRSLANVDKPETNGTKFLRTNHQSCHH